MFEKYRKKLEAVTVKVGPQNEDFKPISESLTDNLINVYQLLGESIDISVRESDISGRKIAFAFLDGMCDSIRMIQSIIKPVIMAEELPRRKEDLFNYVRDYISVGSEQNECHSLNDVVHSMISGFVVLFIDGEPRALAFGVHGFAKRAVSEPTSDVQERGSQEGFVDNYKDNITLVRRRLKTSNLRIEDMTVGETSKTKLVICYLQNRAANDIVADVKGSLEKAVMDTILSTGELIPFLDKNGISPFPSVSFTERPDVFCAKLSEGKVGIIVDGTPHAIYLPTIFFENFQSLDDYQGRPYFTLFLRCLKILGFLIGVFLPGIYVAVGIFHQEIFPSNLLFDIALAESQTPLPIMLEAIVIHIIYEIVREAGMRMPKIAGQTVSIVGALVIGDAAVTAGLIAAPMLIIVALTAICSTIVSPIHQATAILRFAFIIIGGTLGFYGMVLGFALLIVQLCALSPYGVVQMTPFAPFIPGALRDSIFRRSWRKLGKRQVEVNRLKDVDKQ